MDYKLILGIILLIAFSFLFFRLLKRPPQHKVLNFIFMFDVVVVVIAGLYLIATSL
ncbi:MAG TPA: hypothetical protein VD884_09635 [Ohtaekwangia sp.]|nr:hypothetical protein [Ohtaekwangia sp.]